MPSGKALFVLPWDGQVDGLGPAGEMPMGTGTLGASVHAAAAAAGFEVLSEWRPGREALVVSDACALGPHALSAAWQAGREAGRDARITLGGRIGELLGLASLAGQGHGLAYLGAGGQAPVTQRFAEADPLILDPEERPLGNMAPGGEALALSDRVVLPVRNWLGLLWGNLLSLPPVLWRELLGSGPLLLWRILRAVLRAGPRRVPQGLTRGGRVHPSATVEASLLMEGAEVQAGAVVRGCILGPGARVEPLAVAEGCVLGPQAVVQRQALVKYSVLGREAAVGGAMQLGVLGHGAGLKRGSYGMDQKLGDAPVRIPVRGELEPVPLGMAGVCVGHRSLIGSGVWVAPGRVIPQDTAVVGDRVLARCERPDGVGPFRVHQGRLVQL